MRQVSFVGLCLIMFVMMSCSDTGDTSKIAEFTQGECTSNLPLVPHNPETKPVTISSEGAYVKVLYQQAMFRCAQKVHFVVKQEEQVIKVTARPIELNPSVVASCDCKYDLNGKFGPFEAGSYTVKVYHQTDNYGSPSQTNEMLSMELSLSGSTK